MENILNIILRLVKKGKNAIVIKKKTCFFYSESEVCVTELLKMN